MGTEQWDSCTCMVYDIWNSGRLVKSKAFIYDIYLASRLVFFFFFSPQWILTFVFLSDANGTETEKMKQERFLEGRCCVEESLHEFKAAGRKEIKLVFTKCCLCSAPGREWQCWPRGDRAGVPCRLQTWRWGHTALLRWQTGTHRPGEFSGALGPLHSNFLNPVLPLKVLDLNTEKPSLPWVGEACQSGGIYAEGELSRSCPVHFTTTVNTLLFHYFDYLF